MTRKNDTEFIKKLKLAMLESGLNQTKLAKKLSNNLLKIMLNGDYCKYVIDNQVRNNKCFTKEEYIVFIDKYFKESK